MLRRRNPSKFSFIALFLVFLVWPSRSFAWGRKGHEVVAYIAYSNLSVATRKQVDLLLTMNPCYSQWQQQVSGVPTADQSAAIFMLAATWPDLIKLPDYSCQPSLTFIVDGGPGPNGAFSQDSPPAGPVASQNIGYTDDRRHKYWHFLDTPFSPDSTPTQPAPSVNAVSEVILLAKALKSTEPQPLKSYDLVWLEHLVGDLHQPLHKPSRFTPSTPHGDEGGNAVAIVQSPQDLHGYWDNLPGPDDLQAALEMGKTLNAAPCPPAAVLAVTEPASWSLESFKLAQTTAYASPVSSGALGDPPSNLDTTYEANAKTVMNKQLFLAGQRLAALLNLNLT